jgi:hypothetical protein
MMASGAPGKRSHQSLTNRVLGSSKVPKSSRSDASHVVMMREGRFATVPIDLDTAPVRRDDGTLIKGAAFPRYTFQKLERSGFCR